MFLNFGSVRKSTASLAFGVSLALMLGLPIVTASLVHAEQSDEMRDALRRKKMLANGGSIAPAPATQNFHAGSNTKATTETEVMASQSVAPMLSPTGAAAMQSAESKYAQIVGSGGWPEVPRGTYKKGGQNKGVAVLNQRLFIEGYVRAEATQGEFASIYTSATQDGVMRFQRNHGLAASGKVDGPTLRALNVSAEARLATIRANEPRIAEYSKDLGGRYIVVNVPAQQIEAVEGGRVYSRHNAIVGRPERPTPVVMTALSNVAFNPYWNAPASIVERDIVPKIVGGNSDYLKKSNIKVFQGVGGPEIDPDSVNWKTAVVDDYHFRQEPGGENAMATAKINFTSPFGIYLHDTPDRQLFQTGDRFYSSGCVRVDKVAVLINWILNGQDGFDPNRIEGLAQSKERLDVPISNPPQLRVAYLTAWPTGEGTVAFRDDIYGLDGTGFVLGQPMPVGEVSASGERFVLKPIPRNAAAVDEAEAEGFSWFGKRSPRKADVSADKSVKAGASGKTVLTAKSGDKKPKAAGLFDWASYDSGKDKSKTPVKKVVAKSKVVKTTETASVDAKKAATDVKAKKVVQPTVTAAKKTDVTCTPDKDGKLPKDCKVATVAKPKVKPEATAAATN